MPSSALIASVTARDVARVEPERAGDAQDLVADLLRGHGGNQSGDLACGPDLPFHRRQPPCPAGEVLVDDELGQGGGGIKHGAQRGGAVLLGRPGGVLPSWQGSGSRPDVGGSQQRVGPQGSGLAGGVGVEGDDDSPAVQRGQPSQGQ